MPPRALEPSGLFLVDKPAGPSSFQVIAAIRRRTGARTGHAGTLDPFATGLLLVLSGAATRLAPWLVGLDKRYLTEVDLTARTSTGDPEGEVVEDSAPPGRAELEERLDEPPRRGRAGGSGCVRGQRSAASAPTGCTGAGKRWRCRCGARASRRSSCWSTTTGSHASIFGSASGTYVRSIADALGGHCRDAAATRGRPVLGRRRRRRADRPAGGGAAVPARGRGRRGGGGGDPNGSAPRTARRPHAVRRQLVAVGRVVMPA